MIVSQKPLKAPRKFSKGGITAWLAIALVILTATPAFGQFDVLLSPQVGQLELRPGSRSMTRFSLTNQEPEQSLTVRIFARDSYQGERGEYKLSDSAMAYSCVEWLTLTDTLIDIEPGATRQIMVGIEVPPRAMGGAYGAVVFEFLPKIERTTQPGAMATRFDYRFQIPAWLEITVKRTTGAIRRLAPGGITVTPSAEIPSLQRRVGDRGIRVSLDVENTGNIHVFTEGRVIVRDQNRRLIQDTRLGAGRGLVLPGNRVPLRSVLPLPPPGQYTVKAFVEYGGRSPAIAQTTFEISDDRKSRVGQSEVAMPIYLDYRPEKFEQPVPAGGFRTFAISLMNREQSPVTVDVSTGLLTFTREGHMWISEEETPRERSCLPWMTFEPAQFTIDPNRRLNVRATLAVPDSARGGYYGCVVLNAHLTTDTSQSTLSSPLYIPIYVTVPPDLEHNGEIVDVVIDQVGQAVTLKTEFKNTGNIHELLTGSVKIQMWMEPESVEGIEIVGEARFADFISLQLETDSSYVLPGESRLISSQRADGLVAGRYRAEVSVHYGGEKPVKLEREFTIE